MAAGAVAFLFALICVVHFGSRAVLASPENVAKGYGTKGIVLKLKNLRQNALQSGKIKKISTGDSPSKTINNGDSEFNRDHWTGYENKTTWTDFVTDERILRTSLSDKFDSKCQFSHDNPVFWNKILILIVNLFHDDGEFRKTRPDNDQPFSIQFLKFVKRTLTLFPLDSPETFDHLPTDNDNEIREKLLEFICYSINFIKNRIQPCLSRDKNKEKKEEDRIVEGKELQCLYHNNQKKAIQIINNDCVIQSTTCKIPLDQIEAYYSDKTHNTVDPDHFTTPPPWQNDVTIPPPSHSPVTDPFTEDEIINCVKKLPSRKSPGHDNVTYDTIKKNINKLVPALTAIFNTCLRFECVPQDWKLGVITLVPKKSADSVNLDDWRPISLLNSFYKIFMKLIVARTMPWIVETNRLSVTQKGALPRRGLQEHVFAIKTTISDFLHTSGSFYIGYVDLKDAFGSLNHVFMLSEMTNVGYPELFVNITRDIYKDSCFKVRTQSGETGIIQRTKGIIQGCPWSIIASEQSLDKLLRWIDAGVGSIQGYVDDVVFHTRSLSDLETVCQQTTEFLDYTHMEAKPAKCAVSAARRSGKDYRELASPDVTIQNKEIPVFPRDKCYVYLGHDICISNQFDQAETLVADFYKNNRRPVHIVNTLCTLNNIRIQCLFYQK